MIRIGYVIDSLSRDGTQTFLVNLVKGLAERDYEQRVYCLNNVVNADILRALTDSRAHVVVIGKVQLATLIGFSRLFIEFRRWRPVIVQTFLPFGDTIGRALAHAASVPILVSSIRCRNINKSWWQFLLDRMTIRWVDRVIFNSQQVIPFALSYEGVRAEQAVYIPNGVSFEQQSRSLDALGIRSKLGISPAARVIGTVGRLSPQKGHRYLLSAFAQVLAQVPSAVLLVIGDGPLRSELAEEARQLEIAERVHFLGQRGDVPDLLACMDVYVQSSLFEGMPNAVMEAMAAGKPVIATAIDGTKELISDGETGWLVEPSDAKAMAEGIVTVLKNPTEARRRGAAAAQRVRTDFSLERMVNAYDQLYRSLLSEKRCVVSAAN
jgi:glycosyltransferase involved in cell wall biosynthesis